MATAAAVAAVVPSVSMPSAPSTRSFACPSRPSSAASATILRAAAPWTPGTHALWGPGARARAVELCKLGYMLARHVDDMPGCRTKASIQGALVDAWIGHVMPHAITWELH